MSRPPTRDDLMWLILVIEELLEEGKLERREARRIEERLLATPIR
jgi:hypothetical protein